LCLLSLYTNNSIPNIEPTCDTIAYKSVLGAIYTVILPVGTYELDTATSLLKSDANTLKCIMKCDYDINFTVKKNISRLLGFDNKVYKAKIEHVSTNIINIMKVNSIKVECNLISGSFNNGILDQGIHEFASSVAQGYKIVKVPLQSAYYQWTMNRLVNRFIV
jgi:hypothetical protein